MAIQPHSRIESQLTDPTYNGPYLSRIELILKDMLENYGRIAFVGPYDSLEDLPETGQAGYVYLVRVEGSNLCDEYIWDEQEEEYNYVGRFEIDLDDYQTKDLSNPITIDSVVYTTVEAALAAMNTSLSAVKTALDGKISTSNTPGHVMNDGSIDQTQYEKSGVAETLIKDTVGWSGKNLYNRYGEQVSGYLSADGEINASPSWGTTDFEPITSGDYIMSGATEGDDYYCACWYDSNKDYISGSATASITVPANAVYIRYSVHIDDRSSFQLEHGSVATSYEPYHPTVDTVKADKVTNATSGHLAGLDSNGNLTDSGVSPTEEVTVEGNPVTFNSPFEQDAKSVVVSVKPIQDLHGYDHPWVGGAGKNLLPIINTTRNVSGVDYAVNPNGTITTDGTATALSYFVLTNDTNDLNTLSNIVIPKGTTIIASSGVSNDTLHARYTNATYFDLPNDTPFTLEEDVALVYIAVSSGVTIDEVVYSPMIRLATETDPTFAPYSNICPISGIDEVEIGVSDGESEPTTTTIPLPSTLYGGDVDVTNGSADGTKDKIILDGSDDEDWRRGISALSPDRRVFYPNTLFPNSKPAGNDSNVNLVSMSSNMYDIGTTSYYDIAQITSFAIGIGGGADGATIGVNVDGAVFDTVEDFKAWLAQNPLEVCYELATPTTISLTPTDVELLEGMNVVTTNGEKVAVTYGRSLWQDIDDLKTDIEGLGTKAEISAIADSEPNATASQPYAVREHFYKNGKFCTAISEIASGATFTKGTNYVEGTIANNMVKQAVFSGTTSSDGNLKLSNSVINILSAIVTDMAWCVAIPYVSNGNTFIHVIADDGSNTVRSSTAISGIYFYI